MQIRMAVIGLGNVNRNLLQIINEKKERLYTEYGIKFLCVVIADSSGVAINASGFDSAGVLAQKIAGQAVAEFPGFDPHLSVPDAIKNAQCDLVFEASPVNLQSGEPGLSITRSALQNGISVVLANKGPVVLAYRELTELAQANNASLKFSATVCGGLPVVNIGQRDMVVGDIHRVRGIFNSTCNFILDEMAKGNSYDDALHEAQQRGIAETDPSLDVEGWDTANKLLIVANSMLGADIELGDIDVSGITDLEPEYLQQELKNGKRVKLIASAEGGKYSVAPVALPESDFLAQCVGWEMAVEMHTDIYGITYLKLWEREPIPTAASMLRDAVHIFAPA